MKVKEKNTRNLSLGCLIVSLLEHTKSIKLPRKTLLFKCTQVAYAWFSSFILKFNMSLKII